MDDIFNYNMKLGLVVKYEYKQNTWITNLFLELSIQLTYDFVFSNNTIYKFYIQKFGTEYFHYL